MRLSRPGMWLPACTAVCTAVVLSGCGAEEDGGAPVAEACNESALIAQCPPGSSPLFGSAGEAACGGQGGIDILSGTGEVAGRCVASGQCVVACQFDTPCPCGVAAVTVDGVFCRPCEGQAVCGNGVCEGGESPDSCAADCRPDCEPGTTRCADVRVLEECNQRGRYEPIACLDYEVCDVVAGGGAACRRADVLTGFEPAAVDDAVEVPPGRLWRQRGEYSTAGSSERDPPAARLVHSGTHEVCVGTGDDTCSAGGLVFGSDDIPTWLVGPADRTFTLWVDDRYHLTDELGAPLASDGADWREHGLALNASAPPGNAAFPSWSGDGTTLLIWETAEVEPGEPEVAGGAAAQRLMALDVATGAVREVWRTRSYSPALRSGRIALRYDGQAALVRLFAWTVGYGYDERCNCQYYGTRPGPVSAASIELQSGAVEHIPDLVADAEDWLALSPNGLYSVAVRTIGNVQVEDEFVSGKAVELRNLSTDEVVLAIMPTREAAPTAAFFGPREHDLWVETLAGLELWTLEPFAFVRLHPNSVLGTSWQVLPGGRRILSIVGDELRLLDGETGTVLDVLQVPLEGFHSEALTVDRTGTRAIWRRVVQLGTGPRTVRIDTIEILP